MTEASPPDLPRYDALLLVSFGGPEKPEDVRPYLENVVRGRRISDERLREVEAHYERFGGKSPINDCCRSLIAAVEKDFAEHDLALPVYWGNRNWHPMLADTLRKMRDDGVRRALAFFTSAYSSYSSCRQYLEAIEVARTVVGDDAPEVHKLRAYFNHPGFIEPMIEHTAEAIRSVPSSRRPRARLVFSAHSIPVAMADHCAYEKQLDEACRMVAEGVGRGDWQLVWQSRSGPADGSWLEPSVVEHIEALATIGIEDVVVVPIGFVADHMEVVWDLDEEARARATELGVGFHRAATVGVDPRFVKMVRELVVERVTPGTPKLVVGKLPVVSDVCAPDCCTYVRPHSIPPPRRDEEE